VQIAQANRKRAEARRQAREGAAEIAETAASGPVLSALFPLHVLVILHDAPADALFSCRKMPAQAAKRRRIAPRGKATTSESPDMRSQER